MDINLLVINVGNTRVAIGVFESGELTYTHRVTLDRPDDWRAMIAQAWAKFGGQDAEVAGASVNAAGSEPIELAVEQATSKHVQWVGREIDLPIKVATSAPEATGVDRICNIAAAFEQLGKACVVADAGSALTVDLCDDTGTFLGGAIAPGAQLMLNAMAGQFSRLPQLSLARPEGEVGNDTTQAMLHGVFDSLRGLVQQTAERFAMTQSAWPEVIATGGDAETLFADWEIVHAISPDLTLYGIALAYTNHHIKHA